METCLILLYSIRSLGPNVTAVQCRRNTYTSFLRKKARCLLFHTAIRPPTHYLNAPYLDLPSTFHPGAPGLPGPEPNCPPPGVAFLPHTPHILKGLFPTSSQPPTEKLLVYSSTIRQLTSFILSCPDFERTLPSVYIPVSTLESRLLPNFLEFGFLLPPVSLEQEGGNSN